MTQAICPAIAPGCKEDYRRVIRHISTGASIIFDGGTTSCSYARTTENRIDYMETAADEVQKLRDGKGTKLFVGVTGKDMNETLKLAEAAKKISDGKKVIDALVLMPLYITRKTKWKYREEFSKRVENSVREIASIGLPVVLYDYPEMTGGESLIDVWKRISRIPGVDAVKYSSSQDYREYIKTLERFRERGGEKEVYAGNSVFGLRNCGDGVVAGDMNILPFPWAVAITREEGDMITGSLADELVELQKVYAKNPIGAFHYILKKLGVIRSGKDRPFDRKLRVEPGSELARNLDDLVESKKFMEIFGLVGAD
jgi:dihydrodipicolinate synthase/N-acetylneuraminate lyase